MLDQLVHLLGYDFVQNAIAAGVVIAIVAGIVSRFVVARSMSFAVHALAELGFTGAAGAIVIGLSPVIGLLAGTTITALFIGALGIRARERDAVVGVVMAFGLGLGVFFLAIYPRYATEAFAILFGTITGVSRTDVVLLVAIGIATLIAVAVVYRPLTFATVDPEVAEAVQVVGVLLILTLLITPGAAAERLTAKPGRAAAYSVFIALTCVLGGIALALVTDIPVSVFVTSISFAWYLVARFVLGPVAMGSEGRRAVAPPVTAAHHH